MYIFISHSSKDAAMASDICEFLEKNGNRCFLAPRDIRSGCEYAEEIINGVDTADAMLVMLSREANESPHVLREIERAVSKGLPIIVYKLEDVELTKSMEYFLMTHQWMNAKTGDYKELARCVENVENKLKEKQQNEEDEKAGRGVAFSPYESKETEERLKSNSEKKKLIIYVMAAIITLLIAVVVVLLVSGEGKTGDDTGSSTEVEIETSTTEETVTGDETTEKETESEDESDTVQKDTILSESHENQTTPHSGNVGNADNNVPKKEVKVGDEVVFGKYNGEDIVWRVLKISENGSEAVLITRDIITMKAYDAAESGRYGYDGDKDYFRQNSEADTDMNLQVRVRGNSDWSTSNIRTWLNSTKEVVKYQDQAPSSLAMSEKRNGYDNEPGFLYNFTEEEIAAILDTTVNTNGNALSAGQVITTTDKVFLLSMDELKWIEEAGISMLAKPTEAALEQDKSQWYEVEYDAYGVEQYCWWLREPVEGTSSKCYVVGNGYYENNIWKDNVGLEGFGIRPVITVNLQADCIKTDK